MDRENFVPKIIIFLKIAIFKLNIWSDFNLIEQLFFNLSPCSASKFHVSFRSEAFSGAPLRVTLIPPNWVGGKIGPASGTRPAIPKRSPEKQACIPLSFSWEDKKMEPASPETLAISEQVPKEKPPYLPVRKNIYRDPAANSRKGNRSVIIQHQEPISLQHPPIYNHDKNVCTIHITKLFLFLNSKL